MPDFNSEVKAVTQELDSIALSLSNHSIIVRVDAPAIPLQKVPTTQLTADQSTRQNPSFAEFSSQITAQSTRLKNALAAATALKTPPTITSVSPPAGPAGTLITITGTGFGESNDGAVVWVAGVPAHPNSWSSTKIVATVPEGIKKGDVSVTTTGGKSTGTFAFTPDFVPAPPVSPNVPVTRAIPGAPNDPEPIIDAEPGTSDFAAQSTRHRAWESRHSGIKV